MEDERQCIRFLIWWWFIILMLIEKLQIKYNPIRSWRYAPPPVTAAAAAAAKTACTPDCLNRREREEKNTQQQETNLSTSGSSLLRLLYCPGRVCNRFYTHPSHTIGSSSSSRPTVLFCLPSLQSQVGRFNVVDGNTTRPSHTQQTDQSGFENWQTTSNSTYGFCT